MPRLLLILVVSWTYAGWLAPSVIAEPSTRDTAATRVVHVFAADAEQFEAIAREASALPYAPNGLFARCDKKRSACRRADVAGCRRFAVDERVEGSDGSPLAAGQVVEAWEAALRDPRLPHRWLLEAVEGTAAFAGGAVEQVRGLRAEGGDLVVCFQRPVPDWWERLDHPGVWLRPPIDGVAGHGSFDWNGESRLLANSHAGQAAPRLAEVRLVSGDDRPRRLFEAGEIDLAVLYGRQASSLVVDPLDHLRVERAPGWDKAYALWFDTSARWVDDPRFRRWVGAVVAGDVMLGLLFDGRGEAISTLAGATAASPGGPAPPRPFGETSAPGITLAYDPHDGDATRIAARIKAVLEDRGVGVRLDSGGVPASDGSRQVTLISHHPPVEDALIAFWDTLSKLGESAAPAIDRLARASRVADPERRAMAAGTIEGDLLEDARLLPLFRLYAWRVVDDRLKARAPDRWSRLGLREARWAR